MKLDDLLIKEDYEGACRPLFESEMAGLMESILNNEEGFLDPLKFHLNEEGLPTLLDGHHRMKIWKGIHGKDVDQPRTQEVIPLSGASPEEAIEWIRNHQRNRRNDTNEFRYHLGKEQNDTDKTSAQIAEEYGVTDSVVRHSAEFATAVDGLEEEIPGIKNELISEDPPATRSQVVNDPEGVAAAVTGSVVKKDPVKMFEAVNKALGSLVRRSKSLEDETGKTDTSSKFEQQLRECFNSLETWEDEYLEYHK
jgi:uncharacterized protein YdaT